jgi:hypothetical protein
VPAAGTHTCLLASVITRGDHPLAGRYVWEHNNLAQKNLTVVDLVANEFMILPIVVAHRIWGFDKQFDLEVWRAKDAVFLDVSLLHRSKDFFAHVRRGAVQRFKPDLRVPLRPSAHIDLECGAHLTAAIPNKGKVISSNTPNLVFERYGEAWQLPLDSKARARIQVELPLHSQRSVGLLVRVPKGAPEGTTHRLHLVQRHRKTRQIVGGVALEVRIRKQRANEKGRIT